MMRFFVILFLCMLLTSYWEGLGNLIRESVKTVSRIILVS